MKPHLDPELEIVEYLVDELLELQQLFPNHPCKRHFRHGRPRLKKFVIQRKGISMSTTTSTKTYLSTSTTDFTVTAVDQYGFPYTGADLSDAGVSTDNPANVGATLTPFVDGVATLTLTQNGGEGSANVAITDAAIAYSMVVESYVPVLTGFTVEPTPPPSPPPTS